MAVTPALTALHRSVAEVDTAVRTVQARYGDIRAVRRLLGDVERLRLDASELDELPAPPEPPSAEAMQVIDDTPADPSLWQDADDEGLGGYHGGNA